MQDLSCTVEKIESLTPVVSKVLLSTESPMTFKAGQYLRVIMGEKDKRPFSIANAPNDDNLLELHIGAGPENSYASEVLDVMQQTGKVMVDGGHGKAFLREVGPRPTILLAGGTGFSYTFSILKELLGNNSHEPIFLYWGAKTREDLYAYDDLIGMQRQNKYFKFVPVLENPPQDWQGKTGWVHKAIMDDFVSLEPYFVYVAGRFEMAGVAREDFHTKGLLHEHLFGDAYEFI